MNHHNKLALRGLSRDETGQDCMDPITQEELRALGYAAAARANSVGDIQVILNGIRLYAEEHGWARCLALLK